MVFRQIVAEIDPRRNRPALNKPHVLKTILELKGLTQARQPDSIGEVWPNWFNGHFGQQRWPAARCWHIEVAEVPFTAPQ